MEKHGWTSDEVEVTQSKAQSTWKDNLKATVQLTWFLTVSIAALSLSVTVAFSSYDATMSKIAISSIRPLHVIQSLDGFINADGSVSNATVSTGGVVSPYGAGGANSSAPNKNSTVTPAILETFALEILPDEYRFGMAGICRLYNTSAPNTTCTRSLGNTPSIISVLTIDLNTTDPKALSHWIALLNTAQGSGQSQPMPLTLLSRLTRASSALLLTSIFFSPISISLTLVLFFYARPHKLPPFLSFIYIFDGLLLLASAALYTICIYSIGSYKVYGDISPNYGFILFWCAGAGKFLVTPSMFAMSFVAVVMAAWWTAVIGAEVAIIGAEVAVVATAAGAAASGGTTTVYYGGDSGGWGGDSGC